MIRSLRHFAAATVLAAASLTASSASATVFTFSFLGPSNAAASKLDFTSCPTGLSTCTVSQKLGLSVYGSHLNSTGTGLSTLSPASVQTWSGAGLGVLFGADKASDGTHQIDNYGSGSDMVALVFDQSVNLASISRASYSGSSSVTGKDTDISYLAYAGSLTDLATGVKLGTFSDLDSGASTTNSTASSKIWFVAANVRGQTDDAFKLSSLVVNTAPPLGAVPEPATWAMMLVGFGGIGFAMRRRKNKVATSSAFA